MPNTNLQQKAVHLAKCYLQGSYTLLEAASGVLGCVTPENVKEILAELPADLTAKLKEIARDEPHTDQEWADAQYIQITGHTGQTAPEATETWKRTHRSRIEAMRQFWTESRE